MLTLKLIDLFLMCVCMSFSTRTKNSLMAKIWLLNQSQVSVCIGFGARIHCGVDIASVGNHIIIVQNPQIQWRSALLKPAVVSKRGVWWELSPAGQKELQLL